MKWYSNTGRPDSTYTKVFNNHKNNNHTRRCIRSLCRTYVICSHRKNVTKLAKIIDQTKSYDLNIQKKIVFLLLFKNNKIFSSFFLFFWLHFIVFAAVKYDELFRINLDIILLTIWLLLAIVFFCFNFCCCYHLYSSVIKKNIFHDHDHKNLIATLRPRMMTIQLTCTCGFKFWKIRCVKIIFFCDLDFFKMLFVWFLYTKRSSAVDDCCRLAFDSFSCQSIYSFLLLCQNF